MSRHAKLSPSSSNRWLNCPGSIEASRGLAVADTPSVYADEGTFAHEIAERAITNATKSGEAPGVELLKLKGEVSECGRFTADDEMLEHLEEYVDFAGQCWNDARYFAVEARVCAVKGEVYGTSDLVALVGPVLEVADLKYGAGIPVSPKGNTQALIYAIGALNHLKSDYVKVSEVDLYAKVETIRIRIFQPRNIKGGGVYELTRDELERWRDLTLIPGIDRTVPKDMVLEPEPPRAAGDWCRFCPVKGGCYKLRETALEGAKGVFADPVELEVKDADPRDLTVDQLGKALDAIPVVEQWINALREHAYELANKGESIPGRKLVRKSGNRQWRNQKEAERMLIDMLPHGVNTHVEPKLLSPAQAEKKLDVIGKALVGKITSKPDAGTALVSNSDKRPAFRPGDVF